MGSRVWGWVGGTGRWADGWISEVLYLTLNKTRRNPSASYQRPKPTDAWIASAAAIILQGVSVGATCAIRGPSDRSRQKSLLMRFACEKASHVGEGDARFSWRVSLKWAAGSAQV